MFEDVFKFNFFGNSYDSIYVHRNGFVTFGAAIDASYVNASNANNDSSASYHSLPHCGMSYRSVSGRSLLIRLGPRPTGVSLLSGRGFSLIEVAVQPPKVCASR